MCNHECRANHRLNRTLGKAYRMTIKWKEIAVNIAWGILALILFAAAIHIPSMTSGDNRIMNGLTK